MDPNIITVYDGMSGLTYHFELDENASVGDLKAKIANTFQNVDEKPVILYGGVVPLPQVTISQLKQDKSNLVFMFDLGKIRNPSPPTPMWPDDNVSLTTVQAPPQNMTQMEAQSFAEIVIRNCNQHKATGLRCVAQQKIQAQGFKCALLNLQNTIRRDKNTFETFCELVRSVAEKMENAFGSFEQSCKMLQSALLDDDHARDCGLQTLADLFGLEKEQNLFVSNKKRFGEWSQRIQDLKQRHEDMHKKANEIMNGKVVADVSNSENLLCEIVEEALAVKQKIDHAMPTENCFEWAKQLKELDSRAFTAFQNTKEDQRRMFHAASLHLYQIMDVQSQVRAVDHERETLKLHSTRFDDYTAHLKALQNAQNLYEACKQEVCARHTFEDKLSDQAQAFLDYQAEASQAEEIRRKRFNETIPLTWSVRIFPALNAPLFRFDVFPATELPSLPRLIDSQMETSLSAQNFSQTNTTKNNNNTTLLLSTATDGTNLGTDENGNGNEDIGGGGDNDHNLMSDTIVSASIVVSPAEEQWRDLLKQKEEALQKKNADMRGLLKDARKLQRLLQAKESQNQQTQTQLREIQAELEQTQMQLQQSRDKTQQTQTQLEQTQTQLQQTQAQFQQAQNQLQQTQTRFQQTQNQLQQTQNQLQQTQTQLQQARAQLQQAFDQTPVQLQQSQSLLQQTQSQLMQTQSQLQETEQQCKQMETQKQRREAELNAQVLQLNRSLNEISEKFRMLQQHARGLEAQQHESNQVLVQLKRENEAQGKRLEEMTRDANNFFDELMRRAENRRVGFQPDFEHALQAVDQLIQQGAKINFDGGERAATGDVMIFRANQNQFEAVALAGCLPAYLSTESTDGIGQCSLLVGRFVHRSTQTYQGRECAVVVAEIVQVDDALVAP